MKTEEFDKTRTRYRPVHGTGMPVTIQRAYHEERLLGGELLDISSVGVRISTTTPLRFGDDLVIHMTSEAMQVCASFVTRVQWIRQGRAESEWIIGCALDSPLDPEVLEDLVERGALERRENERTEIAHPVKVRWELGNSEEDTEIRDFGLGGLSVYSQAPAEVGSTLQLQIDGPNATVTLEARTTWLTELDGRYLIGCHWANQKGIAWARDVLESQVEDAYIDPLLGTVVRRRSWLGRRSLLVAATITVAAFAVGLALGRRESSAETQRRPVVVHPTP